ncbi:HdeD family acid-resistance protein [Pengzhenrongella sp.]|uniref:HdeD family acid-resistance protein n=1 Tax=Pengzhenrongella sp. TaxID=2888820 RepID=UPI002F941939
MSILVWRGILAIVVGIVAVAWPNITLGAFVVLFAVYAFLAAIMETARALGSDTSGQRVGRALLAVLDVAAGVVALEWPSITVLVLVLWIAGWAFVTGAFDVLLAFRLQGRSGERTLLALGGLVSVALAVVLVIRPDIGAVVLAQVYGLFSLVSGIAALVMAANLHQSQREPHLRGARTA